MLTNDHGALTNCLTSMSLDGAYQMDLTGRPTISSGSTLDTIVCGEGHGRHLLLVHSLHCLLFLCDN